MLLSVKYNPSQIQAGSGVGGGVVIVKGDQSKDGIDIDRNRKPFAVLFCKVDTVIATNTQATQARHLKKCSLI